MYTVTRYDYQLAKGEQLKKGSLSFPYEDQVSHKPDFVHCCTSHGWETSPKIHQGQNNKINSQHNQMGKQPEKTSLLQVFWEQKYTAGAFISNNIFVDHKRWKETQASSDTTEDKYRHPAASLLQCPSAREERREVCRQQAEPVQPSWEMSPTG